MLRLEALVRFHLQPDRQTITGVRERDDFGQLRKHFVIEPVLAGGEGMRVDAVITVVVDTDREVDQLLGKWIQPGRLHHDFPHLAPEALQHRRIRGECAPDVVDVIGIARLHDVVEHRPYFGGCLVIIHQLYLRHRELLSWNTTRNKAAILPDAGWTPTRA